MTRVYYHLEPSGKEYLDKIYSEYKDMVNVISDLMEGEYE